MSPVNPVKVPVARMFLAVEILPVLVSPKVKVCMAVVARVGYRTKSRRQRQWRCPQRQIVEGDIGIGSDTLGKRECDRAGGSRNIDLIGSANCGSDSSVGQSDRATQ